eukprot:5319145-Amphidinium_carterae.1
MAHRHGGSNAKVLVFGHGTFQNAVEVLLRAYPRMPPQEVMLMPLVMPRHPHGMQTCCGV